MARNKSRYWRHSGIYFWEGKRCDLQSVQKDLGTPGDYCIFTNDWDSYQRNLETNDHTTGKSDAQTIERKNLTLRTRIKRLTRKSIYFSKSQEMHDIVICGNAVLISIAVDDNTANVFLKS